MSPEFPFILAIPFGDDRDYFNFKVIDNINSLCHEAGNYDAIEFYKKQKTDEIIMNLIHEIANDEECFFVNKKDWGEEALELIKEHYGDRTASSVAELADELGWKKSTQETQDKPIPARYKPVPGRTPDKPIPSSYKPVPGRTPDKPTQDKPIPASYKEIPFDTDWNSKNIKESIEITDEEEINEIITKMVYDLLETVERGGEKFSGYNKPKRTPNHPSKSHAVLAKDGSRVKLIRFGQKGVKGAGKHPSTPKEKKRRKSFKARHAKNIKKGKMSAAYWANKVKWE